MAGDDTFQLAFDYWRKRGVAVLPPADDDEIERTFAQLKQPLSQDVRRLYSTTNGFADGDCDGVWSLWSLNRILEENKSRNSRSLWFADFLISSHKYCIQYSTPETSAVFIDHNNSADPPYEIAESVEQFIRKYMANPDGVEAFDLS